MRCAILALLVLLVAAEAEAVVCGSTVTGTVPLPGFDPQVFDAEAGDLVVITTAPDVGSPIQPTIRLEDPLGGQVPLNGGVPFCAGVCQSAALPMAGTYTIEIYDSGQNQTGNYALTLESIADSFNGNATGPAGLACGGAVITCGEFITNSAISDRGDSDSFVFDAALGDVVTFTHKAPAGGAPQPTMKLYGPTGAQVALSGSLGFCNTLCTSVALPAAGTYTALVWDAGLNDTGAYNVNLEALGGTFAGATNGGATPTCAQPGSDGTQPIGCGELLSGQIAGIAESDTFTFSAAANDVIVIAHTAAGSAVNPVIRLWDESGQRVAFAEDNSGFCGNPNPVCTSDPLPLTGIYTIEVFDWANDAAGTYQLGLESVSGSFNGVANGLRSPPAAAACTDVEVIGCAETFEGSIAQIGEPDIFTFEALPGDVVAITAAAAVGSPVRPAFRLFAPGGTQVTLQGTVAGSFCIGSGTAALCVSDPLPIVGTYTIELYDAFNDAAGNYNLTLQAVSGGFNGASTGPPKPICATPSMRAIKCGQTLAGDVSVQGDSDAYSFFGELGDVMRISTNDLSGTINASFRLFDPDGDAVELDGVAGFCADGSCDTEALPDHGTYTIELFDGSNDATGDYDIHLTELDLNLNPICENACNNGLDDDNDGLIDKQLGSPTQDPGCRTKDDFSELGDCEDGVDNDRDGSVDFASDLGCATAASHREDPACSDRRDNDGDGLVDWDGGGIGNHDTFCTVASGKQEMKTTTCGLLGPELLLPLWLLRRRISRGPRPA